MIFQNIYTYLILGALVILFLAVYLGGARKFYDKFVWWDRMIHFLAGGLFVSFGVAVSRGIAGLGAFHILLFSLSLSVTLHVLWEIGEYLLDCLTRSNHQRWQKRNGAINHKPAAVIQPAGLADTMNDTIIFFVSSLAACAVWGVWFIAT